MTTKTKVKCPYADKCVDEGGYKCQSCINNEKRSYYRPSCPDYWYPYRYPWHYEPYPYYPWTVTYGDTGDAVDAGSGNTSYYRST